MIEPLRYVLTELTVEASLHCSPALHPIVKVYDGRDTLKVDTAP